MSLPVDLTSRAPLRDSLGLARVLLVHDDLAPRLTLQTLLQAGGYAVDVAASAPEALAKLDERQYELVLSDLHADSPDAGLKVLAYARVKDYRPATALVTARSECTTRDMHRSEEQITVEASDISNLLTKVAELIGVRARRRAERAVRMTMV